MKEERSKTRINEINYNTFGSEMKITAYRNAKDIDVYFPEYDWSCKRAYKEFKLGWITCPYEPRAVGVGYMGEGPFLSKENGIKTKAYDAWYQMLRRCYDEKLQNKKPTYKGCTVDETWHNFQAFAEWYENNYYEIPNETMQLDKDILSKGNKVYGPDTCIIVPNSINSLFKHKKGNIDLPKGVSKIGKKYRGSYYCNDMKINGPTVETIEEAFDFYKQGIESRIKQIANMYIEYLPDNIYNILINYEINIDER